MDSEAIGTCRYGFSSYRNYRNRYGFCCYRNYRLQVGTGMDSVAIETIGYRYRNRYGFSSYIQKL